MPVSTASWSSLHMSKTPRHAIPNTPLKSRPSINHTHVHAHSMYPPTSSASSSTSTMFNDSQFASSSRSSSLAGKKRPRESDENSLKARNRRTKSTGDARTSKDKEAFQRGLIAVFVPNALQESLQGKMGHYNDLLAHFSPTPTNPNVPLQPLLPLLRAITAHVSLLSPELHTSLVSAIIALPWATAEEKFVKSYVGWAGVLVSAQPGWTKEVVGMAVRGLTWQTTMSNNPNSSSPISRRLFHARHHLLISHLLSLIPTLPNILQPLIVRHFPHKRESEVAQTTWVRNTCELIGYCPELGARVWGGIVDRMLRIDVEITRSVDEDEDDEDDEEEEDDFAAGLTKLAPKSTDPFDLLITEDMPIEKSESPPSPSSDDAEDNESDPDPDELSSDDGSDAESDDNGADEAKAQKAREKKKAALKSMRGKLDGMLCYFFEHLEECMGVREGGLPAAEMAAQSISTAYSSGTSTPTSEIFTPTWSSSSTPTLNPPKPSPTPAQSLSHFQTLLNLFSRQILPTSATQHIPFLLFLCSSFSTSHTDLFLGLLVSQALYATTTATPSATAQPVSMTQRVAATVYIGSVVCRARFVTDDQARMVATYLLAYIDGKLRQTRSISTKQIDELPLFYSVCQAVMLIFCFRWRAFSVERERESSEAGGMVGEMELELDEDEEGSAAQASNEGKWLKDLDVLQRALTSELNPLLGCNPTIVQTFAKVAHQTGFAYCFSIIEANQQLSHPRSTSSHSLSQIAITPTSESPNPLSKSNNTNPLPSRQNSSTTISNPSLTVPRQARQVNIDAGLDGYFPFDPYDLPRSNRWVTDLYRTWDEVAVGFLDENSDSEDEEDGDDDDSDTEATDDVSGVESSLNDRLSTSRSFPKKGSSFGDHRMRLLGRDGGLSSSLEGMSISPNISMGLLGKSRK